MMPFIITVVFTTSAQSLTEAQACTIIAPWYSLFNIATRGDVKAIQEQVRAELFDNAELSSRSASALRYRPRSVTPADGSQSLQNARAVHQRDGHPSASKTATGSR